MLPLSDGSDAASLGHPSPQPPGCPQLGNGQELVNPRGVAELQLGRSLGQFNARLLAGPQVSHPIGQRPSQLLGFARALVGQSCSIDNRNQHVAVVPIQGVGHCLSHPRIAGVHPKAAESLVSRHSPGVPQIDQMPNCGLAPRRQHDRHRCGNAIEQVVEFFQAGFAVDVELDGISPAAQVVQHGKVASGTAVGLAHLPRPARSPAAPAERRHTGQTPVPGMVGLSVKRLNSNAVIGRVHQLLVERRSPQHLLHQLHPLVPPSQVEIPSQAHHPIAHTPDGTPSPLPSPQPFCP